MALAAMPVQATGSFASCGTLNWATPLDDPRSDCDPTLPPAGKCSLNWCALLAWLGLLQDNDGNRNDVVYYGLLPAGIPLTFPGAAITGWARPRSATSSRCCTRSVMATVSCTRRAEQLEPPTRTTRRTSPTASASIGEFGLDLRNGAILTRTRRATT